MAQYITLQELADLGLNPAALVSVDATKRLQAILAVSDLIDGYLGRFVLPLQAWGRDIKLCCATLASLQLIENRGTSPDASDRYERAEKRWLDWLMTISVGTFRPTVTDSSPGSSPGVSAARPIVISSSQRGFSVRGTGRSRGAFQGD